MQFRRAGEHVRVRNGKPTVSDGPAVQAEEFLTGYFLIEAESFGRVGMGSKGA